MVLKSKYPESLLTNIKIIIGINFILGQQNILTDKIMIFTSVFLKEASATQARDSKKSPANTANCKIKEGRRNISILESIRDKCRRLG